MQTSTQNYSNHRRFFPAYHFFAVPILAINFVMTAVGFIRDPSTGRAWAMVVALAILVGIGIARTMALRAQDRVIRLEERIRLREVLPSDLRAGIDRLTTGQIIALRFAADDEVPELTRRTLNGELTKPGDIKRAIANWRADHLRM